MWPSLARADSNDANVAPRVLTAPEIRIYFCGIPRKRERYKRCEPGREGSLDGAEPVSDLRESVTLASGCSRD